MLTSTRLRNAWKVDHKYHKMDGKGLPDLRISRDQPEEQDVRIRGIQHTHLISD